MKKDKTIYIKKENGLRMAILANKLLAMWSISERDLLQEKNNLNKRIENLQSQLEIARDNNEVEIFEQQLADLNNQYVNMASFELVLIGNENDYGELRLVRAQHNVKEIYEMMPNKKDFSFHPVEGGHAMFLKNHIESMEEIILPFVSDENSDLELAENKVVNVELLFGSDKLNNKKNIVIPVLDDIENIE